MVFLSPPGVTLYGLAMLKGVFYTYSHVLKIISLEAQLHTSLSLGDIQFSITSVCFGTGCTTENCIVIVNSDLVKHNNTI